MVWPNTDNRRYCHHLRAEVCATGCLQALAGGCDNSLTRVPIAEHTYFVPFGQDLQVNAGDFQGITTVDLSIAESSCGTLSLYGMSYSIKGAPHDGLTIHSVPQVTPSGRSCISWDLCIDLLSSPRISNVSPLC